MLTRTAFVILMAATASAQVSDYDQGVLLIQIGRPEAAVPLLIRATEAHPAGARGWAALGIAYAAQGMYGRAEPPLARACDLGPQLQDACYYQGRALYALDRFEESVQAMEKANRATPKSWKIHLGAAQAYEGLGKAARAEEEFRTALSLARAADAQPGAAFGLFLLRQGRFEEATETLEQVLRAFPASAPAHLQLGRALLEQGKIALAIPHLEHAARAQPASAQAHVLLAKAYVRSGRAAEAQPHFEAAARIEQAGKPGEIR